MDTAVYKVFLSVTFWSAFCAWMVAQFSKMIRGFILYRTFDFRYIVSTGGIISAHSAMVCGLATSLGLNHGFDSPFFCIGLGYALITMLDAATVRRAAGQQAALLNQLFDTILKEHKLPGGKKLGELLGHTRIEVFCGMVTGILVAVAVNSLAILFW